MMRHLRFPLILALLLPTVLLLCGSVNPQTNSGKLIFSDDFGRLLVVNADGTGQTILTSGNTLADSTPAYSPDGFKIAFSRTNSFGTNIFVMNADGTNAVAITSAAPNTVGSSHPTWSP